MIYFIIFGIVVENQICDRSTYGIFLDYEENIDYGSFYESYVQSTFGAAAFYLGSGW